MCGAANFLSSASEIGIGGGFLVPRGKGRKRSGVGWSRGTSTLDSEFEDKLLVKYVFIIITIYT